MLLIKLQGRHEGSLVWIKALIAVHSFVVDVVCQVNWLLVHSGVVN